MRTIAIALVCAASICASNAGACDIQKGDGWRSCVEKQEPTPVYFSRWGAIATDEANGAFGSSESVSEKKRAESKAIKECRKNQGANCQVAFTYHNQCVSVVTGSQKNFFQTGPSRQEAASTGLSRCEKEDRGCKIFYTGCSLRRQL